MGPRITVDVAGEEFGGLIVAEGWHEAEVKDTPELKTGKDSGKKYIEWPLRIASGDFAGSVLYLRTTLEKGDDPKKSKRWLFHQVMVACRIEKVNEKYAFSLDELRGKKFWIKVIVKEDTWNGEVREKNEIKVVSVAPPKSDGSKTPIPGQVVVDGEGVFPDDADSIPF